MIRVANPGSDIATLIHIFRVLHTYLRDKPWFGLDDISATLTQMNLAASSGYVGEQALVLSTRKDRSRDPLYNQSKMYAELFRVLGWIVPDDPNNVLKRLRFTFLGDHAASADVDPTAVFEESALGINYPNRVLAVQFEEKSRVFATILRAAYRAEGHICRDEIIAAILSRDDVGEDAIEEIVTIIHGMRGSVHRCAQAIRDLAETTGIQINTMHNYTRFPLATLTFCGWFERISTNQFYPDGRAIPMFRLTSYGRQRAEELENAVDIRLRQFEEMPAQKRNAIIRLGFYSMLQRANFDTSSVSTQITADLGTVGEEFSDGPLFFSPYQTIRPEVADNALGVHKEAQTQPEQSATIIIQNVEESACLDQTTTIFLQKTPADTSNSIVENEIGRIIAELIRKGLSDDQVAQMLFSGFNGSGKETFYPLVADLFTVLGFDCHASRSGINYERWDAIAVDNRYSIPIEIKSPAEEPFISVKAVRQAVENKIILLSRGSYVTDRSTVTLAVGYNPPNNRAEVSRLVSDIKTSFNINVGIIDFHSLVILASSAIRNGTDYVEQIRRMEGIINVDGV